MIFGRGGATGRRVGFGPRGAVGVIVKKSIFVSDRDCWTMLDRGGRAWRFGGKPGEFLLTNVETSISGMRDGESTTPAASTRR